jgi:O-acetylserine/cysteine efflux transporter
MKKYDLLIGIAIMCLWGFNFSVIKLGVNNLDPLVLTALRFFFAVVPLIFFIKKPAVKWRYLITYGLTFGVGVWGMATWAIDAGLSAGMTSLLLNLSVISSLIFGRIFLHERITLAKGLGAGLSLVGLFLIVMVEGGSISWLGLVLILAASVFWSINGLLLKLANTTSIFAFNIWSMVFAPIPLLLLAWLTHGPEVIIGLANDFNLEVLFSVLFQAYPTTLLGYWVWNKLIVKYSLSIVAPLTLLVPIFGLLGGFIFYDEAISSAQIVAAILIILGLFISQKNSDNWLHFKNERVTSLSHK